MSLDGWHGRVSRFNLDERQQWVWLGGFDAFDRFFLDP